MLLSVAHLLQKASNVKMGSIVVLCWYESQPLIKFKDFSVASYAMCIIYVYILTFQKN